MKPRAVTRHAGRIVFVALHALTCLLCAVAWAAAAAQTMPQPIIRTHIAPASAMVGQSVTMSVTVLVPSWFTAPIEYPATLAVPQATAQLSGESALLSNERIDGAAYAGLTRNYILVAQQPGQYRVPAMTLQVSYAVDGATRNAALKSAAQAFSARFPPGAEGLGYFIASSDYRIKQSVEQRLDHLKVGDTIVRHIDQSAPGVASMNLPALNFALVDGLGVYAAEPKLNDSGGERGSALVGARLQEVAYVLRKRGHYELPGVKIGWYDPPAGRMRWTRLASIRFDVAPNPDAAIGMRPVAQPPPPPQPGTLRLALVVAWLQRCNGILCGIAIAILMLRRYGPRMKTAWRNNRQRRRSSEGTAFRTCCRALRTGDPAQAMRATMAWLAHVSQNENCAPLERFCTTYGDEGLCNTAASLQRTLYAPVPGEFAWNPQEFEKLLRTARRRWLASRKIAPHQSMQLADLNP